MTFGPSRHTSGRIAVGNLSAEIHGLQVRRAAGARVEELLALSNLLFLRGDLLGRLVDHDEAEVVAHEAVAASGDVATTLPVRAHLATRFHRFVESGALLDDAKAAGLAGPTLDDERATLLQATGRYREALALRERRAGAQPGVDTLGALATLLAEMGRWQEAEAQYLASLEADAGASPFPSAQLAFEWAVGAMRRGDLDRAEHLFLELDAILPEHVPGRGHRAEVAIARGALDAAEALVTQLLDASDDPEYRATYAEILAARGDARATQEAARAAAAYERLLARRPEAYADHAAAFFMGVGNRPERAVELAWTNWRLRDTPRARKLLDAALRNARHAAQAREAA